MSGAALPDSGTFDASNVMQPRLVDNTSVEEYNPFMDWQTSDWLELDANSTSAWITTTDGTTSWSEHSVVKSYIITNIN
jgi:hypothetical protein